MGPAVRRSGSAPARSDQGRGRYQARRVRAVPSPAAAFRWPRATRRAGQRQRTAQGIADRDGALAAQVLLLTVLEGFTVADAAHILGIDVDKAERSLQEARRELQRVASVRVLVIEDEAVIALDVADT